ncbi:glucans biosynthesis glucosyltransferase MdoH [Falsiroseomonas tokyonensis]|uniref:Glucans biosynthesis glucosyltransferase MdoH n=1 Tax=Falsiroseomonas tokyonensis TaxID=430521 RepID=A0ABV7BNP3_9PROT|nr:glucans biosynthesis glucosyltransferase MdoH [Falsiroseomonas tokyonensis]MBU8537214.1 glucans biosynthesis glucosyltransferase MdoH [Falsiroseomonas tokyonensis]
MTAESPLLRRSLFALLVAAIAALLLVLTLRALWPGGIGALEWAIFGCLALTTPWAALSAANALVGLVILLRAPDPPAAVLPALARARPGPPDSVTALFVCLRNEDMSAVLPPLSRLLRELEAEGAGDRFRLWLLSDTQDPQAVAAEEAAVQSFLAAHPTARYRRRADNAGYKAGNVMEALDHQLTDEAFFLTLDADSVMSASAVLRLVSVMEADPKLGIVQQLIVGRPATAAFPRLFQFGMRAGMRAWATGQAWWQMDAGPYWGHNAILRVAPFRDHAKLEALPDGSRILSHDMVESVRLQSAGWAVRCLPAEDGSQEANPPALPEFLRRDERWGAGNMQYLWLFRLPGMTWLGRLQLLQAILLFLGAPLYALALLLAAANGLTGGGAATPMGALALAVFAHWLCYFAPKLAGYAQVLLQGRVAQTYGGRAAFARGALAELVFMQLFEPLSNLNKALFLARLPFGARPGWLPQNRTDRGVSWRDATRLLWPHSTIGLLLTAAFALVSAPALLLALPFTAGMILAVPLCVATADPGLSAWLRRHRIAAVPEELAT